MNLESAGYEPFYTFTVEYPLLILTYRADSHMDDTPEIVGFIHDTKVFINSALTYNAQIELRYVAANYVNPDAQYIGLPEPVFECIAEGTPHDQALADHVSINILGA